ncbi:hypothetical protein [Yeosuana marina]|uniref:hypothetical protein n=1 Tax=Yeosuana marina TaxID=1565536 RepID=UPI0030ED4A85
MSDYMITRTFNLNEDKHARKQFYALMKAFNISDYKIYKSGECYWNWEQAIIPQRELSDLEKSLVSAINTHKQRAEQV